MGITTRELDKLVSTGQLFTTEFAPDFIKQMQKVVKESGAFDAALVKVTSEQNRMMTEWQDGVIKAFNQSEKRFSGFFKTMTIILKENKETIKTLVSGIGLAMQGVGRVLSFISPIVSLVGNSFGVLRDAIANATDRSRKAISELTPFELILLAIADAVDYINIALLYFEMYVLKVSEALGGSETTLGRFAEQLGAILVFLPLIALSFKAIAFSIRMMLWPLTAAWKLIKKVSGAPKVVSSAAGAAGKVGSAGKLASVGKGVFGAGGFAAIGLGSKLYEDISNMFRNSANIESQLAHAFPDMYERRTSSWGKPTTLNVTVNNDVKSTDPVQASKEIEKTFTERLSDAYMMSLITSP